MSTSNLIYNTIAETYGYNIASSTTEHLKFKLLLEHCNSNHSVLDIGCANGIYSIPLAKHCKQIIGIDINQKMIEQFNQKSTSNSITNVTCELKDASELHTLNKGPFDIIFSYSTLLLVPKIEHVLSTIPKIMSPNGVGLLDLTGKYNLSQRFWKKWYSDRGHHTFNAFSYRQIEKLLRDSGLSIIKSYGLGFCDQWKYLPFINKVASKFSIIDKFFHIPIGNDIDYFISNLPIIKHFANRWLIVVRKSDEQT